MQVEHKTEKGTLRFVKEASDWDISGLILNGYTLIGLTSEVTEEWLRDIGFRDTDYIEDGLGPTDNFVYKLDSFKSLIKFKNIQLPSVVLFKEN